MRSMIARSEQEIERRKNDPGGADYFQGHVEAARQIAILLAIDVEEKAV